MSGRTRDCPENVRRGRMNKAQQFFDQGVLTEDDLPDAAVSSYVLAGVAAADVICCSRLGEHAQGEDHREAVALLEKADASVAKHLGTLLQLKTKVAYTHQSPSADERKKAKRAVEALLDAARRHSPPTKNAD
jgi:hypothetical protein